MARDAALAADADVNFAPYDNDGNGYVDAFIVVHAGAGAEQTGSSNDIWSHKWVLAGGEYVADTTKIFAYLTVPEDAASASARTSSAICSSASRIFTTPITPRKGSETGA